MRTDTGDAITRCGLADGERTLPTTRRTTARVLTARTTATPVRLAPAAMLPSPKHTVRPERIAPGARVSTSACTVTTNAARTGGSAATQGFLEMAKAQTAKGTWTVTTTARGKGGVVAEGSRRVVVK